MEDYLAQQGQLNTVVDASHLWCLKDPAMFEDRLD